MSDLILRAENAIARVVEGDATHDEAATALQVVDRVGEVYRTLKQAVETAVIEWVKQNGEIVVGDTRYYVGPETSTRCRNVPALVQHLAEVASFEDICRLLASDAFKPGACREVLRDRFGEFFSTTVKDDLKTGKPRQRLHKASERFLPKRKEASCGATTSLPAAS